MIDILLNATLEKVAIYQQRHDVVSVLCGSQNDRVFMLDDSLVEIALLMPTPTH